MHALKHGNTAFGYESTLKFFAGIPAFSAAPLPCGMALLAANPSSEESTLACAFTAAWLFEPNRYLLQLYYTSSFCVFSIAFIIRII